MEEFQGQSPFGVEGLKPAQAVGHYIHFHGDMQRMNEHLSGQNVVQLGELFSESEGTSPMVCEGVTL